jgi:dTDP-4-dehydrorhamnose 3,5-epimerase
VRFSETGVAGAYLIEIERKGDDRGYFARSWCRSELEARGLSARIEQINVGFNRLRGTLRGMHFQVAPHAETKIVRCTRGSVFDVVVDLRPDSPTFRRWTGVELTADNGRMLYIPEGCAHGYQTLEDASEICYLTSKPYAPDAARGVRHDDPAFGVLWPLPVTSISQADRSWPDFGTA